MNDSYSYQILKPIIPHSIPIEGLISLIIKELKQTHINKAPAVIFFTENILGHIQKELVTYEGHDYLNNL